MCNYQALIFCGHFATGRKQQNCGREARCAVFLQTKHTISVKPYSVDEFFDVEMVNHQQREAVPLLSRHGAEGFEDDLIRPARVCGCFGVAVTQVDKPGQDLFESIQEVKFLVRNLCFKGAFT